MKKLINTIILFVVISLPQGCDLVDPTDVVNPNIVEDVIIGTSNSASLWISGLNRELAQEYNVMVDIAELASDNYVNTQTFYNQNFDVLDIRYQDTDVNTLQAGLAQLREDATVGIEKIHPGDPIATDDQLAEMYFFRGMAFLLSGEMFKTLPMEGGGAAVTSSELFLLAIADFQQAETLDATNVSYKMALARTYYNQGDATNATTKATEAITSDADYFRAIEFDAVNGPTSVMQDALYDRGNFDDYQPLPSLDFLDPKYYGRSATEESPIYFQKIEEAHLINAEAQIASNDLAGARQTMKDIIALVASRPTESFQEVDQRTNTGGEVNRPDVSTCQVRFGTEPYRSGLVLDRAGVVTVPVMSGTSLDDAYVDAQLTADDLLEALYLLRQEIFIAEGRRMIDLGIKLPVSEREFDSNTNITDSDLLPIIPAFLPTNMDEITYDASVTGSEVCTITHNMNAILVANKADANIMPFF